MLLFFCAWLGVLKEKGASQGWIYGKKGASRRRVWAKKSKLKGEVWRKRSKLEVSNWKKGASKKGTRFSIFLHVVK